MSVRNIDLPSGRSGFAGDTSLPVARRRLAAPEARGNLPPRLPPMTDQDLPPHGTKRWVMRRKAEVVAGVRCGLISLEEACRRYTLSEEEFLSWQRLIDVHGVRGLRATRLQDYRSGEDSAVEDGETDVPPSAG